MARAKAKKEKKGPQAEAGPLGKVQKTYVEANRGKISAAVMAADLGVDVGVVNDYLCQLPQLPQKPAGNPALEKLRAHPSGATVMTADQSMADDASVGASPYATFPLTQAQRDYVAEHRSQKGPEDLARDTGLLPHQVRSLIDALDAPREGREKFYARHSEHLHKIRPDEPIA